MKIDDLIIECRSEKVIRKDGSVHYRHTYTPELKKALCEEFLSGKTLKDIHDEYGLEPKVVSRVLKENGIDAQMNELRKKHARAKVWTLEECIELAKTCNGRGDFGRKYQAARKFAKKNGWFDLLDQYYIGKVMHYSLKDKIHLIYAYEFPDTKCVYVGRTMNLTARHANHKNTSERNKSDSVMQYCVAHGFELPEPKIVEEDLNAAESQEAEGKWVEWYKENGWILINRAATGKGSSSLGSTEIKWDYAACEEAAATCSSRMEFRSKYQRAYLVSVTKKWINDFFNRVKREDHYLDRYENCLNEARVYSNLSDIKKNDPTLYNRICINKWNDRINEDMGWAKFKFTKKRKENAKHINTLQKRVDNFIKTCKEIYDTDEFDYSRVHENYESTNKKVLILYKKNGNTYEIWRTPYNHYKCLRIKAANNGKVVE